MADEEDGCPVVEAAAEEEAEATEPPVTVWFDEVATVGDEEADWPPLEEEDAVRSLVLDTVL